MAQHFWRLPAGVDEVLPPQARRLELLRRTLLDLFHGWGYDYIEPPMIEYLDALLVGNDLSLQTLKVPDQVSGRTLGVRADMTSLAARIDANSLGGTGVRRLCYAGPLVRASTTGVWESRVPIKAGAELYGCVAESADLEIICMAIDALRVAGIDQPVIELGHVGLVRGLVAPLRLDATAFDNLMAAVRIKSESDIRQMLTDATTADLLCSLVCCMGEARVLDEARELFAPKHAGLMQIVAQLESVAQQLLRLRPKAQLRFDLSEPVGFGYHQALVFALYDREHGRALARGGRYDGIGEQFGNARPATGFDINLKTLIALTADLPALAQALWVPWIEDAKDMLRARLVADELRAKGRQVVEALDAADTAPPLCNEQIVITPDDWRIEALRSVKQR